MISKAYTHASQNILICILLLAIPSVAFAQQSTITKTVEEAMTSGDHAGIKELSSRGAKIKEVLSVEHLPKGGVAAELLVEFKGKSLRYPVKLMRTATHERCDKDVMGWQVTQAPDKAFTSALLNVLTSGQLPQTTADLPAWTKETRLPALPVVVTQSSIFTPYGKIAWSVLEQEIDPASPMAEVAPPQELVKHSQRWVNDFLEEEPGAAAVDLVLDRRISWQLLNRTIFGVSSVGLYRLNLITETSDGFNTLAASAPVFGSLPGVEKPVPLVLGYYPVGENHGWRVSQGKAVLHEDDSCDAEMSFCTTSEQAFIEKFGALSKRMRAKKPTNPSFATFATTKDVTVEQAVVFWQHAAVALGILERRIFLSYIKR